MKTEDLKRLAGRTEAEERSRLASASLPDLAAADGLLDVAVAEMDIPLRVSGVEREARWRERNELFDLGRI